MKQLTFQGIEGRTVVAAFDGGSLLLCQIEHGRGYLREFARCFRDDRKQRFVQHSMERMLAQRIYGLFLVYVDLVDHEELRDDPVSADHRHGRYEPSARISLWLLIR